MTKDEIQAAIKFINDKFDQDYIETEEYYHIFKYHGDTIRSALQSALDAKQSNADTVDLDALKEKMISDFEEEKESELSRGYELGLCHAVDYLAQNYNITRKTK